MNKTQACYPAELRELADAGVGLAAGGENESAHCWLGAATPWGARTRGRNFPNTSCGFWETPDCDYWCCAVRISAVHQHPAHAGSLRVNPTKQGS